MTLITKSAKFFQMGGDCNNKNAEKIRKQRTLTKDHISPGEEVAAE